MSVMANNFKMKFAGLLRGLLRRVDGNEDSTPQPTHTSLVAASQPLAAPPVTAPVPQSVAEPVAPGPAASSEPAGNRADLEMPLLPILEKLPADLRAKWIIGGANLAQATVQISMEKVLPQLALGTVKITFGELRRAAPSLFRSGEEYDSIPITLPLNDVLARLNPALLARTAPQKTVTAPREISGPFSGGAADAANGVAIANTLLKPSPSTTHLLRKAPPAPEPIKMPTTIPVTPPPASLGQRPVAPAPASAPIPMPSRMNRPAPAPAPQPPMPPPTRMAPAPALPTQSPIPFSRPSTAAAKPAAPAVKPAVSAEPAVITVSLAALSENWPEPLRQEIAQTKLSGAQVVIPVQIIEPALKRGRVIFSWNQLRSWIRPAPAGESINEGIELELPLPVLAPLFVPRKKTAVKAQAKATLPPSTVPNLFFGFPQPQPEAITDALEAPLAAPAAKPLAAKPAETDYFVLNAGKESARGDDTDYKRAPAPSTDFSSRRAMPKDIIAKAAKIPGVAGAVVALPDGLKVAHQLPPDLNPDTVAAFLPQLFSRVSQCSKELRMGELNNLSFTIGNVPWKIFRVNSVYFAAFGRAGEPLPGAQLAALAGELDRKN